MRTAYRGEDMEKALIEPSKKLHREKATQERTERLLNKKKLIIKLLSNRRMRGFAIKLLKEPRVRHLIVKQITRRLRRR